MNWAQIRAAIESYLSAQWVDDGNPRTPIQWENFLFDPQLDAAGLPADPAPFLRCVVVEVQRARRTMTGNPSTGQIYSGLLMIQAFSQAGIGPGEVSGLIDSIDAVFKEKRIQGASGTVDFSECRITGKDNDAAGAWFYISLEFPFEHEVI